jgi:hypothetical protein
MADNKFKHVEDQIKEIIVGLPHNASKGEKIAAICRKTRIDKDTAKHFL